MREVAVIIPVNVTYEGGVFSYDPPQPIIAQLPPNQNYAIVFTLLPTPADPPDPNACTTVWADNWITWDTNQPPPLQTGFTPPLPTDLAPNQRALGVFNDNDTGEPIYDDFRMTVMVTSPDPDIVLDPP